jgi:phosphate transport system permease protein
MTGIVAQEMGEVEFGSIHYRALFMVGIALFLIALLVNLLSQNIAGRYKANY